MIRTIWCAVLVWPFISPSVILASDVVDFAASLIGRPYVWGLAAFGQAGVESVLEILRRELLTVMRQAGTRRIAEIDGSYVVRDRP